MIISRSPQIIRTVSLITVMLMGLSVISCEQEASTHRAGPRRDDTTLFPGRPMLEANTAAPDNPQSASPHAILASINVAVKLSPALAKHAAASDAVFIFARAAQGPRIPLAIVRKQVKDLPVSVTLDDTLAMLPEMKLSDFSEVVVGARISRSGDAIAQPGDLEGYSTTVKPGGKLVEVIITKAYSGDTDQPENHPKVETRSESGFIHPKTAQTSALQIPPVVKAKWKSVELSITAAGGQEQRVHVAIGGKVAIANTGLNLSVAAFVPAFMSDAGVVTSSSNRLDNPAVQLQLNDRKGKITQGWVFQNFSDFNSFTSNRVSVRLLSAADQ